MRKMNPRVMLGMGGIIAAITFILGWILREPIFYIISGLVAVLDLLDRIEQSINIYSRLNIWIKEQSKKGNGKFHTRILTDIRLIVLKRRLRKLKNEVCKYVEGPQAPKALKDETLRRCHMLVVPLGLAGVFGLMATVLQFIVRPTEASTQGIRAVITWLNGITYFWILFGAIEGYLLWRLYSRVNSYYNDKNKWQKEETDLNLRQAEKDNEVGSRA